ncbi:hypothetical protein FGADI_1879 [Fusarium gaditjirri]|uniref:DUF7908 domain-containing protein n=1 Tax=Fusarium gaditjirri TaxID=282569 RepID=A0A8H4TK00_9HYPO|nr:hypothetical protein FGADI_1879 [Fusarium gaditjirri]
MIQLANQSSSLISLPDNDKRVLSKQATGGFVGNENPGVCTFAAVFPLSDGLLLENGVPIYYSGDEYKKLSGQRATTQRCYHEDIFIFGWQPPVRERELPGGPAGFCQDTSGKVYIKFSSGPPGCVPVDLSVYGVEQCQNGKLSGLDTSRTRECHPNRLHIRRGFQFVRPLDDRKCRHGNICLRNDEAFVAWLDNYNPGLVAVIVLEFLAGFNSRQLWDRRGTVVSCIKRKIPSDYIIALLHRILHPMRPPHRLIVWRQPPAQTSQLSPGTAFPRMIFLCFRHNLPRWGTSLDFCEEECSDLNAVTVNPETVTVTEVRKCRVIRGIIIAKHVMPVTRIVAPRDDDEAATAIFPTQRPECAVYCDSADEDYDACSSLGVTRFTTTLSTETDTTTAIIITVR